MMAETTSPRSYLPECYYDEICPPGRAHPSDWIDGMEAFDRYFLAKDDENADYRSTMVVGEIVPFMWVERYPSIKVEILDDGALVMSPDPGGNMYWLAGDFDTQNDRLDTFIHSYRGLDPSFRGTLYVEVQRWADQAEPWRLDLGLDRPCFTKAEVAELDRIGGQR